jgi:hypothetical protein
VNPGSGHVVNVTFPSVTARGPLPSHCRSRRFSPGPLVASFLHLPSGKDLGGDHRQYAGREKGRCYLFLILPYYVVLRALKVNEGEVDGGSSCVFGLSRYLQL